MDGIKLYELINNLKTNGYTLLRCYPNREVWNNGIKSLTIPTNRDIVQISVAKDLLLAMKG